MKKYFYEKDLVEKTKEFDSIINSNKIIEFNPENVFNQKLNEIENEVKNYITELKGVLIPPKDKNLFLYSESKYFLSDPVKLVYIEDITNQSQKAYCIDNSFCL